MEENNGTQANGQPGGSTEEEALRLREKQLNEREMHLLASKELIRRDLSREAEALIDYTDREACLRSVEALDTLIRREAARLVEKRLNGRALPGGAASIDYAALSDREYYALTMNNMNKR